MAAGFATLVVWRAMGNYKGIAEETWKEIKIEVLAITRARERM